MVNNIKLLWSEMPVFRFLSGFAAIGWIVLLFKIL